MNRVRITGDQLLKDNSLKIKNNTIYIKDNSEVYIECSKYNNMDIVMGDNSSLTIIKAIVKEQGNGNIKINLNGINSKVTYKIISYVDEDKQYDIVCNHNNKNTKSNIICNGVSINDNSLIFNITTNIKKGMTECEVEQSGKIRIFGNGKCESNPILNIEEMDCIAHHAANVGRFGDDEIFYLESRGLKHKDAVSLLIGGFFNEILNDFSDGLKKELLKKINLGGESIGCEK